MPETPSSEWAVIVKAGPCEKCSGIKSEFAMLHESDGGLRHSYSVKPCPTCNGTGYRTPTVPEINEWLAVNVKGWTEQDTQRISWWDEAGPTVLKANWSPLTDANHALMLVKKDSGICVSVEIFKAWNYNDKRLNWKCHLYQPEHRGDHSVCMEANTFPEALSLAAAKATVAKMEENGE